jgi:hypothetical protein
MDISWTSKKGATAMIDFRGLSVRFFRTKRGSVLLSLFAVVSLLSPVFAGAQELSATLSGVVTDATGAVIPHASVTVARNGVNAGARAVQTDGSGNYVVTNLPAGTGLRGLGIAAYGSARPNQVAPITMSKKPGYTGAGWFSASCVTNVLTRQCLLRTMRLSLDQFYRDRVFVVFQRFSLSRS